jgi:anti-anti-sigma factor
MRLSRSISCRRNSATSLPQLRAAIRLARDDLDPVAGGIIARGRDMHEKPHLPDAPACQPDWTAVTGAAADMLAWGIYSDGHLVVAALDGELDLASQGSLGRRLDPLTAAGRHLILDLSALRFCDCAGLGLFLRLQRQAAAAGGALHLLGPNPRFGRLLALTGTRELFQTEARPCRPRCCIGTHLARRPAGPVRA